MIEESPAPATGATAPDDVPPDILWSKVKEDKAHAHRIKSSNSADISGVNDDHANKVNGISNATNGQLVGQGLVLGTNGFGSTTGGGMGGPALNGGFNASTGLGAGLGGALPRVGFVPSSAGLSSFTPSPLGSSGTYGAGNTASPMSSSQNSPMNSPGRPGSSSSSPLNGISAGMQSLSVNPAMSVPGTVEEEDDEEDDDDDEDDDE